MKMRINLKKLSLQEKMSCVFILANMLVFLVTLLLFTGINSMSREIDMVYEDNMHLNELSDALTAVQDSMTDYLNAKTSDSLEEFYRNEQTYTEMVEGLNDEIAGTAFLRMERSIRHMSRKYLDVVGQTIEAKRGRNVEKYRVRYENATQMYGYIDTYINSLNNERFRNNSENYSRLSYAFRRFETISILVLTVVIVGNVVLIIRFTGGMIRPLKELATSANEVAKGNFDTNLIPVAAEDEIGIVTKAFNQMVVSIRQYIERLRQSMEIQQSLKEKELMMEAHLKDAQLKYLQAQINPHFLYNTLDSIIWMAETNDSNIVAMTEALAKLFRISLNKGNEEISLERELEHVKNYLIIQSMRYADKFTYEISAEPGVERCRTIKLILQPIVENCIYHGIKKKRGTGKITIRAYRREQNLIIEVSDDGCGMPEEICRKILSDEIESENISGSGIGVKNVNERIQLRFGKKYGLSYSSEEGVGTTVTYVLPYNEGGSI